MPWLGDQVEAQSEKTSGGEQSDSTSPGPMMCFQLHAVAVNSFSRKLRASCDDSMPTRSYACVR